MSGMSLPGAPDTPVPQQWPTLVTGSHQRCAYALIGPSRADACSR